MPSYKFYSPERFKILITLLRYERLVNLLNFIEYLKLDLHIQKFGMYLIFYNIAYPNRSGRGQI